jgi:hypothetical protein
VWYDHRFLKKNDCVPVRTPEPIQLATVWAAVALSVPPTNPDPVAVQVIWDAGIVLRPDRKSPVAPTVNVTGPFPNVRAFTVIVTGPGNAGMLGIVSGSASGKLIDRVDTDKRACEVTDAFRLAESVCAAAGRPPDRYTKQTKNVSLTE